MLRVFPNSKAPASAFLLSFCLVLLPALVQAQQPADLILHNGKIATVDANFSMEQALAIRGQRIAAVGTNEEVLRLAGPNTQVLDLKGRTVIPGFVDTHRHMYNAAENDHGGGLTAAQLNRHPVDWRGVRNKDDVIAQIKGIMDRGNFPPGEWLYLANQLMFISGGTVEQATILYNDLHRFDVDKVTPNNPVILSIGIPDFMGVMVNTKAWEILDARYGDFIRRNGRYWLDAGGRPDGHLEPPASRLALPYSYNRAADLLGPLYKKNMEELNSMGLTTIATRLPGDSVKAYQWLESRGEMTMRLGYGPIEPFGSVTDFSAQMPALAKLVGTGTDKIWVTGVGPTAVDGVTTRACTDQKRARAYGVIDSWFPTGQCHYDIEFRGAKDKAAPISDNYYRNWTLNAGLYGVRFANTHVAGDKSHRLIFNIVEEVQRQKGPEATKGWAVDHCDMVNPEDFERGARLGITFSCYVARSISEGQEKADAYGEEVAHKFLSPVKSLLDAGAKVVYESDSNSYLWDDMETVITRKDDKGIVWGPQERVDRPTALRMITSWAAEYMLRPEQFGSLEVGKLADLQVLDKDYFTVPEEEIHTIQPQLTIFDGKPVFVHTSFAQEYNFRPSGAVISSYRDLVARRRPASVRAGGG